jgi:hypothetical protein
MLARVKNAELRLSAARPLHVPSLSNRDHGIPFGLGTKSITAMRDTGTIAFRAGHLYETAAHRRCGRYNERQSGQQFALFCRYRSETMACLTSHDCLRFLSVEATRMSAEFPHHKLKANVVTG